MEKTSFSSQKKTIIGDLSGLTWLEELSENWKGIRLLAFFLGAIHIIRDTLLGIAKVARELLLHFKLSF